MGLVDAYAIDQYKKEKTKIDSDKKMLCGLLLFLGIALIVAAVVPLVLLPVLGAWAILFALGITFGPGLTIIGGGMLFFGEPTENSYRRKYFNHSSFFLPTVEKPTDLPEATINPKSLGAEPATYPNPSQPEAGQAKTKEKLSEAHQTGSNVKPGGSRRT